MNDDALKNFDEAVAQWEKEDPGVSDIETPPHGSTEHETVLPGLDLSEGQQPQEPVPSETKAEPPSEPWARVKFEMDQQKSTKPSSSDLESKMQSVGWTPKERSGPPDYEKLLSDIQNAERSANATRIGQQSFQAVAPSFHADSNAGSAEIAAAKAPLEVEQQRQAMEAKQQAADEERLVAGKKARLDDPSSAESRRAQAEVKDMFPDSRRVPSGLEQMSANELAQLRPSLVTLTGQDSTAATAKGRDEAAATAKAAAEKAKADAGAEKLTQENTVVDALRETAKKAPRLSELGLKPEDLDKLDRKALEEVDRNLRDLPNKKPAGHGAGVSKPVHSIADVSDPNDRARVQLLLDNTSAPEEFGRKDGPRLIGLAKQIDPKYDPHNARLGKEVRDQIAKDPSIDSINTAIDHIDEARKLVPQENFDSQWLNRMKQAVLTGTGSAELTKFQDTLRVASAEYSKALGENAQAGKEEISHILDSVQSKDQINAALDQIDRLLSGRIHAIAKRYKTYTNAPLPGTLSGRESEQPVKTWRSKSNPSRTVKGTLEQLKSSKNPDDWEEAPGG